MQTIGIWSIVIEEYLIRFPTQVNPFGDDELVSSLHPLNLVFHAIREQKTEVSRVY